MRVFLGGCSASGEVLACKGILKSCVEQCRNWLDVRSGWTTPLTSRETLPVEAAAAGTAAAEDTATVSPVEDSTDKTTVREDMAATSDNLEVLNSRLPEDQEF